RETILEARGKVEQPRRQGKLGALDPALTGVAGEDLARNPHTGKVRLTISGLRRRRVEIRLAVACAWNSRRGQVEPLRSGRHRKESEETDQAHESHDKPEVKSRL